MSKDGICETHPADIESVDTVSVDVFPCQAITVFERPRTFRKI